MLTIEHDVLCFLLHFLYLTTQLQRLASTCKFGTHLNEALRGRFVCGLQRRAIQKRLLTEDVNFEKALQIAQGKEAAETDAAQINRQGSDSKDGHKVYDTPGDRHKPSHKGKNKRPPKVPPYLGNQRKSSCLSCGKEGHHVPTVSTEILLVVNVNEWATLLRPV